MTPLPAGSFPHLGGSVDVGRQLAVLLASPHGIDVVIFLAPILGTCKCDSPMASGGCYPCGARALVIVVVVRVLAGVGSSTVDGRCYHARMVSSALLWSGVGSFLGSGSPTLV